MTGAAPWSVRAEGLSLTVRLTPNARDDRIEEIRQLADGMSVLAVRVRAVPEDGAANAALEKLIAKTVRVGKTRVRVVSGHTQRVKTVLIEGEADPLIAGLAAALG